MDRATLFALLCLQLLSIFPLRAAESPWPPAGWTAALVQTRDGQHFYALLPADSKIGLAGSEAHASWAGVKRASWGTPLDPVKSTRAKELVKALGSDQFDVREKAVLELKTLDVQAVPALKEGQGDVDAEMAARSKKLLDELSAHASASSLRVGDELRLGDVSSQNGILEPPEIRVRTRWGDVQIPRELLDSISIPDEKELRPSAKALMQEWAARAPLKDAKAPSLRVPETHEIPVRRVTLEKFNPSRDGLTNETCRMATFDVGPDYRTPLLPGACIAKTYQRWGLQLHATAKGSNAFQAVADLTEPLKARSGPLALAAAEGDAEPPPALVVNVPNAPNPPPNERKNLSKGDLILTFDMPVTEHADKGEPAPLSVGGIFALGFYASGKGKGATSVELFDVSGKSLLKVEGEERKNLGERRVEFFGFYSDVPVHSVQIRRPPADPAAELRVDDLIFTPVLPSGRDPRLAAVTLASGELLLGALTECDEKEAVTALRLRPLFLPSTVAKSAELIPYAQIATLEPPSTALLAPGHKVSAAFKGMENPEADQEREAQLARVALRAWHAVLLQSGETFPATLLQLDEKEAVLLLSGGVKFSLPRSALRKVDLSPKRKKVDRNGIPVPGQAEDEEDADGPIEPEAGKPLVSVKPDEKTGVEFREKDGVAPADEQKNPPAADPNKKPEPAKPNPAQGMPRMDNAEILKVDLITGELIVDPKDGGGAWPINLSGARYLVFPALPETAQQTTVAAREWILTLRSGQHFEARPLAVTPTGLKAEIAGGAAEFPHGSVRKFERKP